MSCVRSEFVLYDNGCGNVALQCSPYHNFLGKACPQTGVAASVIIKGPAITENSSVHLNLWTECEEFFHPMGMMQRHFILLRVGKLQRSCWIYSQMVIIKLLADELVQCGWTETKRLRSSKSPWSPNRYEHMWLSSLKEYKIYAVFHLEVGITYSPKWVKLTSQWPDSFS
jgi:hypothetical protein